MSILFERLADTCHNLLLHNNKLLTYLKHDRHLTDDTISQYKLGAFPRDLRVLYRYIHAEELKGSGLIWSADKSPFRYYPIVIPIRDFAGNNIAIGARCLFSANRLKQLGIPKYRNTSYSKTSHLFGLDKAKYAIRENNKVFVVEGYFDVIMAHQCGFKNVVATCGTMFSYRQLSVLARYTNNICLLFDNDEPGQQNVKRVMSAFESFKSNINIDYQFTPDGYKDLDEFLQKGGNFKYFGGNCTDIESVDVSTLW